MAADQHYCLACGERRGKPRFAAATTAAAPAVEEHRRVVSSAYRPSRATSGMAFLGTVLVLLIALGVGVLIGHNNSNGSNRAAAVPPQIVTINGGSGGGGSTAASAAPAGLPQTAAPTAAPKVHATAHQTKAQVKKVLKVLSAPVTKHEAAQAAAGEKAVLGGSNLPPPTVTVGAKGSGPGYSNGQFNGDFFGQ